MRTRIVNFKSQGAQLVAAGLVIALILVLALVQPSPWVYFAVIWMIPVGLGVFNLALPDFLFDQSAENNRT